MKLKTTLLLLFSLILELSILYSQPTSPPKFNAEKAAGIYTYNNDKVIKNLKLKDELKIENINEALNEYNKKMNELSELNSKLFDELNRKFNKQVKIAFQRRDKSLMNGVMTEIKEKLKPIKNNVLVQEQALNEKIHSILEESHYQKWLKYQKKKRNKMEYKAS